MTEATTQRDANLTWIFPFHGEKEKEKEEQNFKEGGRKTNNKHSNKILVSLIFSHKDVGIQALDEIHK